VCVVVCGGVGDVVLVAVVLVVVVNVVVVVIAGKGNWLNGGGGGCRLLDYLLLGSTAGGWVPSSWVRAARRADEGVRGAVDEDCW
jgi:hypothetical protein